MNYSDMLYEMQALYRRGVHDKSLTMYQAFAYAYDEMDMFLHSQADSTRIAAFTALFVVVVEGGLEFVRDDPFTRDVIVELGAAYSKLPSLGLGSGSNEDEKLMLEHARLVANYTGVVEG